MNLWRIISVMAFFLEQKVKKHEQIWKQSPFWLWCYCCKPVWTKMPKLNWVARDEGNKQNKNNVQNYEPFWKSRHLECFIVIVYVHIWILFFYFFFFWFANHFAEDLDKTEKMCNVVYKSHIQWIKMIIYRRQFVSELHSHSHISYGNGGNDSSRNIISNVWTWNEMWIWWSFLFCCSSGYRLK